MKAGEVQTGVNLGSLATLTVPNTPGRIDEYVGLPRECRSPLTGSGLIVRGCGAPSVVDQLRHRGKSICTASEAPSYNSRMERSYLGGGPT